MTNAIDGLKPELFWRYFAEIARIPLPSKHERITGTFSTRRKESGCSQDRMAAETSS
jgi:hypothetical protein